MKYLYTILAILVLASCTATETPTEVSNTEVDTAVEATTTDIENELSAIENEMAAEETIIADDTNKMVKVDAKYNNPQQEVDMTVEYSLDAEGKIETINVSATNWDLSQYNEAAQVVIGQTLEEAAKFGIAGGSETNAAFQNALK